MRPEAFGAPIWASGAPAAVRRAIALTLAFWPPDPTQRAGLCIQQSCLPCELHSLCSETLIWELQVLTSVLTLQRNDDLGASSAEKCAASAAKRRCWPSGCPNTPTGTFLSPPEDMYTLGTTMTNAINDNSNFFSASFNSETNELTIYCPN